MGKVIYKYAIANGHQEIWLPKEAKILTVQTQEEQPQIWAMVDPARALEPRRFIVYPTGYEMREGANERLNYIGTFQLQEGILVFHLFEIVSSMPETVEGV